MIVAQKLQMDFEGGKPQEVAFNDNMVSLVRAAKVRLYLNCKQSKTAYRIVNYFIPVLKKGALKSTDIIE